MSNVQQMRNDLRLIDNSVILYTIRKMCTIKKIKNSKNYS